MIQLPQWSTPNPSPLILYTRRPFLKSIKIQTLAILIRWSLIKSSRTSSIIVRNTSIRLAIVIWLRIKPSVRRSFLWILGRLNTTTRRKFYQTQAATINIRMPRICRLLLRKWLWVRREREDKVNSFLLSFLKMSWDNTSLRFCWPKAMTFSRTFSPSAKTDCWITSSMSQQSWCSTASIPIC